jgi:hypothetical protein
VKGVITLTDPYISLLNKVIRSVQTPFVKYRTMDSYMKQGCQADGALFQGSSRSSVLKRPFSPRKEAADREHTAFNAARCLTSPYMVEVVSGKCFRQRFNHDS